MTVSGDAGYSEVAQQLPLLYAIAPLLHSIPDVPMLIADRKVIGRIADRKVIGRIADRKVIRLIADRKVIRPLYAALACISCLFMISALI